MPRPDRRRPTRAQLRDHERRQAAAQQPSVTPAPPAEPPRRSRVPSDDEWERMRAFEEAAHGVAAFAAGWSAEYVSIRPHTDSAGRIHHGRARIVGGDGREHAWTWLVTTVAGPIASFIGTGWTMPDTERTGDAAEIDHWLDVLGLTEAGERATHVGFAILSACDLLEQHWPGVVALAEALLAAGHVDGADAQRIWQEAMRAPAPLPPDLRARFVTYRAERAAQFGLPATFGRPPERT
jgi:hypothetical protein